MKPFGKFFGLLVIIISIKGTKEIDKSAHGSKDEKLRAANEVLVQNPKGSNSNPNSHSHYPIDQKFVSRLSYAQKAQNVEQEYCEFSQSELNCKELDGDCLECTLNNEKISKTDKCIYGENVTVHCKAKDGVVCKGPSSFKREMVCQFCYQTLISQQSCNGVSTCNVVGAPREYVTTNCTVDSKIICLGNRRFNRRIECSWKNGYKWSTAMLYSITLGGFGADRFYLGRWQEGIGKLFSFGGLGIWSFLDIILISIRYLGPSDGSLYVD